MKPNAYLLILISCFFLCTCAPLPSVIQQRDPGDELLSRAEKYFNENSYGNALALYIEYLSKYPDRSKSANALMRMGEIYQARENHTEARAAYERLVEGYPDSAFIPDAMINILETLYQEGRYEEVINRADNVLKNTLSNFHFFKVYERVGDSQTLLGFLPEAFTAYSAAYTVAGPAEKEQVISKMKVSAGQLKTSELLTLLGRIEEDIPVAYLLYHLGMGCFEEKKYTNAEKALAEFIERFPEHEYASDAKVILIEIEKKFQFDRQAIGCLLPLSGPYKAYGDKALKGIELAFGQLVSIDSGPLLKIIVKDTASDPEKAALAAKELIDAQVGAVIGPLVAVEPAASLMQEMGVPIITLTQKENITDIGEFVFRNFLTPKAQIRSLVSYAIEALKLNKFAILYPNENYGQTFMNLFWDEVIAHGGTVLGIESYDPKQTDFAEPIKKIVGNYYEVPEHIKMLEPSVSDQIPLSDEDVEVYENRDAPKQEIQAIVDFEAVFIPDSPMTSGLIIPQFAFYDVDNVRFLGTNLWHSDRLIQIAAEYVQGAVLVDGFFADSDRDDVRNFVSAFLSIYDETPSFIEAVAYDTAMILIKIVGLASIESRVEIKEGLLRLGNYPGVTGFTSFDANGECRKTPYILKVKGRQFVETGRN